MINIYGAGISGSYLGCLLEKFGYEYRISDKNSIYKSKCAYGFMYNETKSLLNIIGFNISKYLEVKIKYVNINGIKMKVNNLCILDKNKLVNDMRNELKFGKFDNPSFSVDSTGTNRSIIKNNEDVSYSYTKQEKIKNSYGKEIFIYANKFGYSWYFPINNEYAHIGSGSYRKDKVDELLNGLKSTYDINYDIICKCKKKMISTPFNKLRYIDYNKKIICVGESGGFVSIFGEGNTTGMRSSLLLYRSIRNSETFEEICNKYMKNVNEEFSWIIDGYKFFDSLRKSSTKSFYYIPRLFEKNRCGLEVNIGIIRSLLKKIIW